MHDSETPPEALSTAATGEHSVAADAAAAEIARLRARVVALEQDVHAGHEAEEMLRGVFAAVPVFVVRYGHDLRIKGISRLQPGFNRDQVMGTSFFDYIPANQWPVAQAAIDRAWQTGQPQNYKIQGAGANGTPAHYESYVAPVRDRDGSLEIMLVAD